ncbi:hypothetical protein AAY473_010141, partial [Plecturocebus cupreus]
MDNVSGAVAYTCNSSTLGGWGGWITWGQEFETSLTNMRRGFTMCQAGLKLLTSKDLPASASQGVGITGVSHCAWPEFPFCLPACFKTIIGIAISFAVPKLRQRAIILPETNQLFSGGSKTEAVLCSHSKLPSYGQRTVVKFSRSENQLPGI